MTTDLRRVQPMQSGEYSRRVGGSTAIACPCCGMTSVLDWPYRVANTGLVTPRWMCATCDWSGTIRLVDWGEQVLA